MDDEAVESYYIALFKKEVSDRDKEIDPNNEMDWYAITVGWAIANGFSPDGAHDFALHLRYHTDLA